MLRRAAPHAAASAIRWLASAQGAAEAATHVSSSRQWRHLGSLSTFQLPYPPAFVFDIDGVLIRGSTVLEPAKRALAKLYSPDGQRPKFPLCFLTNGGGVTEAHKAGELSSWLCVNVAADQVVLSHSPFEQLTHLKDKPVLLAGLGRLREVAEEYGFQHVSTTEELDLALPHAAPFSVATVSGRRGGARQMQPGDPGSKESPFAAVLVLKDPSDWYRDLQLILDVVLSRGAPAQREAALDAPEVPVYFSNPDMLWANEAPRARLGQGAFAACLQSLHREMAENPKSDRHMGMCSGFVLRSHIIAEGANVKGNSILAFPINKFKLTGRPLPHVVFYGKPYPEPYRLVEALLRRQATSLGLDGARTDLLSLGEHASTDLPFSAIYAVGDNPASDVRGANAVGAPWVSVLVRTGVFSAPAGCNSETDPAQIVVEDVEEAVDAALHRARYVRWHSMR